MMVCASLFLTTDWSFPVRARRFRDGLLAKFGGQIRQCDLIVLAQAQGPDEHVAQLTDVAGPRIAHERVHGAFRTPDSLAPHAVEDIAHDQGDVLDALARGGRLRVMGLSGSTGLRGTSPPRSFF